MYLPGGALDASEQRQLCFLKIYGNTYLYLTKSTMPCVGTDRMWENYNLRKEKTIIAKFKHFKFVTNTYLYLR